ncbi:hypothetical protein Bca4012_030422 [Brassica carinata]|uniref:Uncharacterized protein n=2 Tax=Brassica TaxID=3705 RepID=A0A8X7RNC4_BRACI|nr:uncharacterized protein LOC125585554 [Brassica napus]KAG2288684.1 hypothetical protein Bca52824_048288 [Brassica carinata]CAF1834483.1 unnamed protein product [Brassica napus]
MIAQSKPEELNRKKAENPLGNIVGTAAIQAPLSTTSTINPMMTSVSPTSPKPPEPPDYYHKKRVQEAKAPQLQNQKISLKYSDEEKIDELVDSVSVVLDQKEKQVTDHEYKHAEAKLADYYSLSNEYQDDSAKLIKSSNDLELSVERIWEPGGLPTEAAQWYWTEKFSSHCEAFLCPQMQMLTWDPGSFKMLGRETGNNTHWLEDKREAQHKQNEVMKLTSSWHNCLWEPGGSPAEVAHWNWIVSCHEHAVTLELILKLHEPHLQRNTKGEVLELSCSQKFGVEKDVEATVGKWPEKRHRLLFYATLPVLITGNRYSIKSLKVTLSRLLDQNSATMRKMRWLHMIELVCSMMIKLDEKISLKNLEVQVTEEVIRHELLTEHSGASYAKQ